MLNSLLSNLMFTLQTCSPVASCTTTTAPARHGYHNVTASNVFMVYVKTSL
jgi:hypothetical protein